MIERKAVLLVTCALLVVAVSLTHAQTTSPGACADRVTYKLAAKARQAGIHGRALHLGRADQQ